MSNDKFFVVKSSDGGEVHSRILTQDGITDLYNKVMEVIAGHPSYDYTEEDMFVKMLILQGICVSNIIAMMGYSKILVVPSFRNSKFPSLYNHGDQDVRYNLINNLWPVINSFFGQDPHIYYTFPSDHVSFCRDLARDFHVDNVVCNKRYVMGDDTFWVENEGIEFDAVFLAGQPIDDGVTFAAADIKADFASICTEDFDLIEMYDEEGVDGLSLRNHLKNNTLKSHEMPPRRTRLTGEEKDIREICEYINNNTVKINPTEGNLANIVPRLSTLFQRELKVY